MADTKRKLFDKLKEFHNDKEFVVGVMSNAKHDEDRDLILKFIESEKEATIEDVILLSLHLANERK
jgi:hypothetical protein